MQALEWHSELTVNNIYCIREMRNLNRGFMDMSNLQETTSSYYAKGNIF